eukprot:CAMPEP_0118681336 /NCGR_PEP_ID=MMETSP0800-20121206/4880_1 /TAXON_ID=210618 ORGANISM="Striatella unipunctata, Strain CCMP2910" /NCGR_SAMPLE_ID=MMETSP0800 /ASSEMBLY_ACC=CAM_ASM_000638 /LENGTH=262 /DNA_ID=CAMNT_0006577617 /DNA_START=279 /DNA_END=1067 /DNA_ORIENTATION=-
MHVVAHWINKRVKESGFDVWIWTDTEAEQLFERLGGHFLQTWEYTKSDKYQTRLARMTDYLRLVLMHEFGGVYLDVDILPCNGLEFMVNDPGAISFPYVNGRVGQIVNCAISSPPRHPVIELALSNLFEKGAAISTGFLDAAGPFFVSTVVDEYFELQGVPFPSISKKEAHPFPFAPQQGQHWTKVADTVRFANLAATPTGKDFGLVHLAFGSWFPDTDTYKWSKSESCEENVDLIPSFLDDVCNGDEIQLLATFRDCGKKE